MSLEIEARFTSPQGELLLIAWFEGNGVARLVMTTAEGLREEVQIKSIEASLAEVVGEVIGESHVPGHETGPVTARLRLATPRARVGRTVKLPNRVSKVDALCGKLVAMAELMARDEVLRESIRALKRQMGR